MRATITRADRANLNNVLLLARMSVAMLEWVEREVYALLQVGEVDAAEDPIADAITEEVWGGQATADSLLAALEIDVAGDSEDRR